MSTKSTYEELEKKVHALEKAQSETLWWRRILFERNLSPIAIIDNHGRYLDANRAFLQFVELDRESLLQMGVFDFSPPEAEVQQQKNHTQVWETGGVLETAYYIHGKIKVLELNITPFSHRGRDVIIGIGKDITDRKKAEERLHLFKTIIESSHEAVAVSDVHGKLVYVNPAHETLFGRSLEEAQKLHYRHYYPPESIEVLDSVVTPAFDQGESWEGILDALDAHGRRFPLWERTGSIFDDQGNLLYGFGFMHDDTERMHKEIALRESEKKFRSMMEAMQEAAYISSANLIIEYMNPRMIRKIGRDATGQKCFKAVYGKDEKCDWCVLDQVLKGEHVEYELSDPKDDRYYAVSNSPIQHADGSISKLTIFRDITTIKAIEAHRRYARKMESIGTMAGGVAHDFNNILYIITGNAELGMEETPEDGPVYGNLEEIKTAALKGAAIVKQLLDFCRESDAAMTRLDAVEVIKNALKFLRATLPSLVEMHPHFLISKALVEGNAAQISQMMMNLCVNAAQAMEATGGMIEISVQKETFRQSKGEPFTALASGDYLKIVIRDNGPGIEPQFLDRIFDPYFTTREVGQGSGMGLAVVHGIVKDHKGAIEVDSQPGEGAAFHILLPLASESRPRDDGEFQKHGHGHANILLVDDEASVNNSTRLRRILVRPQGAFIGAYQDIRRWMQRGGRAKRQARCGIIFCREPKARG